VSLSSQSVLRIQATPALIMPRHTVEAWVMPRALPSGFGRSGVLDDNTQSSIFVYANATVRCLSAETEVRVPGLLQVGVWASLACTFDGTVLGLWHNGVLRASQRVSGENQQASSAAMAIGSNLPGLGMYGADRFYGLVDNVRAWRRVLTPAQICASAVGCAPN
jgi:hypothetical protein